MQILTLDNKTFSLNNLPDEVDENTRFAVLDNSNPADPDFFFMPLIFLESFNAPAMVLRIGDHEVTMPIDWSIAVGDSSTGCDIEVLPLTSINDRGFEALCFNPLSSFRVEFKKIEIEYKPDFRQAIANSWPQSIDDREARQQWDWKPEYDLAKMVQDMLNNLRVKLNAQ